MKYAQTTEQANILFAAHKQENETFEQFCERTNIEIIVHKKAARSNARAEVVGKTSITVLFSETLKEFFISTHSLHSMRNLEELKKQWLKITENNSRAKYRNIVAQNDCAMFESELLANVTEEQQIQVQKALAKIVLEFKAKSFVCLNKLSRECTNEMLALETLAAFEAQQKQNAVTAKESKTTKAKATKATA